MDAYYEKIRVAIDEIYGVMLYVVYYEMPHGFGVFTAFNAYESEDTAEAVVNAIKNGQIIIN